MEDQGQQAPRTIGNRWKSLLLVFGLVFAFGIGGLWAAGNSVSDCLGNLDPSVSAAVSAAIASQPGLAGNQQAQLVYLGILSQESGLRNVPSGGTSTSCPSIPVSYGIGQVNYAAHVDEIRAAGWTGYNAGAGYCANLKSAGDWMLAHPNETTKISASIFAQNLKACGGNALCAANRYCGGCDKHSPKPYTASIQEKIRKLGSCGDGSAIYYYDPGDGGAPFVLKCPEIYLSDALNKANQYFVAASLSNARAARQAATEQARANMSGSVLTASGIVGGYPELKTPLGDIRMTMCLDYISNFYNAITALLSRVNFFILAINTIISQAINWACSYVATSINNALTSLCLPLPDISFGLSLGGQESKGCNGLSFSDVIYITQNRQTEGLMMSPMSPQAVTQPLIRAFNRPGTTTGTSQ